MDSPGAKIRINHRQHPRAKRLTGSKQKLTELGLIAHTTISKAFPLLSVDSIILMVQPMVIGNEVTLIDSARSGQQETIRKSIEGEDVLKSQGFE